MAKSNGYNRRSANVTPPSLTSLLSPKNTLQTPSLLTPQMTTAQMYPRSMVIAQDRRFYQPKPPGLKRIIKNPGALPRYAAKQVVSQFTQNISNQNKLPWRTSFNVPRQVAVCLRRKARKEIMHALKLTHKNGAGGSRRRTPWSTIKC